jgi:hypothetical protein
MGPLRNVEFPGWGFIHFGGLHIVHFPVFRRHIHRPRQDGLCTVIAFILAAPKAPAIIGLIAVRLISIAQPRKFLFIDATPSRCNFAFFRY